MRDYFVDGIVRNAVNFPSISLSDYQTIAPYLELGERLGSFASQLSTGRMEEVGVRYYGDLTELNTPLICSAILVGVLKPILSERVTLVNALSTAKERGIHFLETRSTPRPELQQPDLGEAENRRGRAVDRGDRPA